MRRIVVGVAALAVLAQACAISFGNEEPSPPPSSASPTPVEETPSEPALPKQSSYEARVEGKFRGAGLYSPTVTMVPRCRNGGECDVVADSPKGGFKFEYAKRTYTSDFTIKETCRAGGYTTPLEVDVQFKFHIARAKYVDEVWRATAIKVVQRVNSPGARDTFSTPTTVYTITCEGYHEKNRGTMVLAGRY